jgi:hypothetical protein
MNDAKRKKQKNPTNIWSGNCKKSEKRKEATRDADTQQATPLSPEKSTATHR